MIRRIELLVHAGAPSSRQNDDKYKAQAQAYEAFQGRPVSLTEPAGPSPNQPPHPDERAGAEGSDEATVIESPTIFLDDSQLAITGLESQLLTSSLPVTPARFAEAPDAPQSSLGHAHSASQSDGIATSVGEVAGDSLAAQAQSSGKRRREDDSPEAQDARRNVEQAEASTRQAPKPSQREESTSSQALSLSSYLKTPVLDRSIKKRRVEQDRKASPTLPRPSKLFGRAGDHFEEAYFPDIPDVTRGHIPSATAPAAVTRSQNSIAISEPTSELPTSYSLSDITSESSRARVVASQRSTRDSAGNAPISAERADASTASASSSGRSTGSDVRDFALEKQKQTQRSEAAQDVVAIADDTPTESGHPAVPERTEERIGNGIAVESENQAPPRYDGGATKIPSSKPPTAASAEALRVLPTLPISIHPPEPEISIKPFTTHVTPALTSLVINKDMTGRYQPAYVSRDLRTSERGYWTFDPSSLDADRQVKFWRFLEQAIGSGNPGWGVWCEQEGTGEGLGTVKVYCWGEVVEHVYLLLYVASSSQVRKLGARWIDAEGKVVVHMRTA